MAVNYHTLYSYSDVFPNHLNERIETFILHPRRWSTLAHLECLFISESEYLNLNNNVARLICGIDDLI